MLEDILITEELSQRAATRLDGSRCPNWQAEAQAMQTLARQMASGSQTLPQSLVEKAAELCQAPTAGISLLERTPDGEEIFRWLALAGTLAPYVGGSTPRSFSPCGVCLERGTPQLFSYPDRYFTYLQKANSPIVEELVLPLIADSQVIGTLWILSYDEQRHFDSEDVRVMTSLADFAATAFLLNQQQTRESLVTNPALESEIVERVQVEEKLRAAQRWLELALRSANLGIWTYNVSTDEFWADARAGLLHGHEPHEVHTFAEAGANIHPEDRDRTTAAIAQATQDGSKLQLKYRVIWRDGSIHGIASYAEFIQTDEPNGGGIFYGVAQDISDRLRDEGDRKRAEAALRESEAKYRALFELIDQAFCLLEILYDEQGEAVDLRYHDTNRVFERQTGIANAEGKTAHELIPNLEPFWIETYAKVAQTGESVRFENHVQGTDHWFSVYASRVGGEGSRFVAVVFDDITDRKQAEAALRESEEQLRLFVTASSDIVYKMSANWSEMRHLKGKDFLASTENPSGTWLEQYIPLEDQPEVMVAIQAAIRTKSPFELEHRVIQLDGTIGWTFSRAIPLLNAQHEIVEWFGAASDITDRKRHEANLAFLAEVSQDLVHLTNVDETMDALGAKIGGHFNVSRCAFVEINEAADEAVCEYDWHRTDVPSLVGIYRIGNFFTDEFQRTLRAGEAFVTRDIYADLRVDAKNLAALNIASFVTIPIIRDGQLQFVLCIYDSEARDWRDDEIELMHEITSRIWTRLERAHAEAALRVSEEKYRTLFDSIDEGYCVIEMHIEPGEPLDYRFIATNRAFEKQSTLVNAQGKWMRELRPNHEESWFEIYRDVALTGEPIRFEHGGKELGDRWFTLYAFRIGEPNQRRVAVLFNDITERKQAEQAKTVFLSNVSHEFRTPLTLLLSPLQDALSDRAHPLSPVQQSQLQLAHRNAIRLLKLVNTLLDVPRIEAGRIQAVYEPTDLATLTTELASSFESATTQAGLQLVIDCLPLPELVYVDHSMWEMIVLNLLSNAFKFTFAGEITVRLTSASNSVELTVQDTGIGIPAAELPRLFERFYQVKGAKGRSFEGSGIGLSLVQELVLLHGGTIGVSSVEGEGSCFKVLIPTGFAHLPLEQIGSPQTLSSTTTGASADVEEVLGWLPEEAGELFLSRGAGEQESLISPLPLCTSAPLLRTARILLVDDNADMRTYLKRLLEERWQVETAANGALALTQIQQNPPDLVLTDIMMPEMDGLQLLQALRANPQTRTIPIILLSARAGEEATIEALETGADDYLIKPFSARELMARVETHLQLALLRQERSANRFKNEFLLTVTHELQSPLTLILGWTRLLQTKSFNAHTTAQALATIERSATIEAKLIKDLLDVSGLLSGKVQLKSQLVDLVSLVQNLVTTFREAAEAKQIQLIETISDVALGNVIADSDRLKQIIANLLENAIKFTPPGGRVAIRLKYVDSEVHITVVNTGIGIPPDFLPYVFDCFTQAEVPSRHSPGGVGIGGAIARLLVELHKGTIEVASEGVGRGATFTVRLPLITSTEAPVLEQ